MLSVFLVLYVWQNVEVMRLESNYRKELSAKKDLIKENDFLLYKIEQYKRMENVERYARENGLREITPEDFDVLVSKGTNKR
ncbi:MAG: hypothetical protein GY754_00075 [bacterium]|nr:hypothetical protein [bacterium]